MKIEVRINGQRRVLDVDPWRRLLDVLREELDMTGTKEGCGEGECGACTVLLEGRPANSCLIPVGQVHERELWTIEGVAGDGQDLQALEKALIANGGAQCGICTPGIVLCAHWILERGYAQDRETIREKLSGNLCRCTGYQSLVESVVEAARDAT